MSSEWMKVMLDEIARKESAAEQDRLELERRRREHEVLPADKLMERAEALAKTIVAMAPLAVAACLEAVRDGSEINLEEAIDMEAKIFGRLCGTADKEEGTKAFLEKRPPRWIGR